MTPGAHRGPATPRHRDRRPRRRLLTAGLWVVLALGVTVSDPPAAVAAGDSGARSTVVGRGDIVTSILGWARPRTRPRPNGSAPPCAWRTLTDAQLEWLVSVAAQAVGLGLRTPLLDPLRPHLDGADLPDGDLQGYVCGLQTYELRFVERSEPRSALEMLYRQMITRLPAPEPIVTPRPDAVVPVGQPVFVSIDPEQWQPVGGELTWQGVTAQVEATPSSLRIITGDPASATTTTCDGPGRPFRAGQVSATEQARHPEACSVVYRSATAGHRSSRSAALASRPDLWLGTVTVVWTARWRVGGGPWQDLGPIPRTRLIARSVREVTTSIEHTPPR